MQKRIKIEEGAADISGGAADPDDDWYVDDRVYPTAADDYAQKVEISKFCGAPLEVWAHSVSREGDHSVGN